MENALLQELFPWRAEEEMLVHPLEQPALTISEVVEVGNRALMIAHDEWRTQASPVIGDCDANGYMHSI